MSLNVMGFQIAEMVLTRSIASLFATDFFVILVAIAYLNHGFVMVWLIAMILVMK
jgi:hypothetical protein